MSEELSCVIDDRVCIKCFQCVQYMLPRHWHAWLSEHVIGVL